MRRLFLTTLRLNLDEAEDRKAYEHLRSMDKKQYRSYSKAIVAAINDSFDRKQRLADDPYLETREKEDAFLRQITQTIERSLLTVSPNLGALLQLTQAQPPSQQQSVENSPNDEDASIALDFVDSFRYDNRPCMVSS